MEREMSPAQATRPDAPKPEQHRETKKRLYVIWAGMKGRCKNPAKTLYAGRGISVCEEWSRSFMAFRDWALSHGYADNLEIDRIDSDGNYEPSNCRWSTRSQQVRSRRKSSGASSKYLGVVFCDRSKSKPWRTEEEAARARDEVARKGVWRVCTSEFPGG